MAAIRTKWTAAGLAAVALGGATLAATAAGGASDSARQQQRIALSFLTIGGKDQPVYVRAEGAIDGVGTETQTATQSPAGQINHVTLHFKDGTVRLDAHERYGVRLNRRACTGTPVGGGTFTITGGTGAYRGATGKGTFTVGGHVLAQRTRTGRCLGERTPRSSTVFHITVNMVGSVAVPSA